MKKGKLEIKKTPLYCPQCSGPRGYSQGYDAYYCGSCDFWLEERCTDKECGFCSRRPFKPSEAPNASKK